MKSYLSRPLFKARKAVTGTFLVCASQLFAASALAEQGSSLQQIIRGALTSYPAIVAAREGVNVAGQDASAARSLRFPSLTATSAEDIFGTSVRTVTVQQPIFLGGVISAGIEGADIRRQVSDLNLEFVEGSVSLEVVLKFFEAKYLSERIDIQRESLTEHQKLVDLMGRRVENQVSPITDLLLAKARLEQVTLELTQLETLRNNVYTQLSAFAGFPVTSIALPKGSFGHSDLRLKDYVDETLRVYPQVRIIALQSEELGSQITLERSRVMPKIYLRHDKTYGGSPLVPDSNTYVSVEFQSGAGLSALYQVRAARSRQLAKEAESEEIKIRIKSEVEREWNLANSARRQAENFRRLAEATREVYESFSRQYAAGRKTWVDVLNAWREDQQIRALASEQEFLELASVARLNHFSGRLNQYK